MSYKAIVSRINTRPLEGSDNILLGTCKGYQVIVGKNVQDGDLGVFFEAGGQLSEVFAKENDLVRRKDSEGKPAGGYFEENRRVKAIRMRGAKSEGFWCPLKNFAFTGVDINSLTEGYEFTELNGISICNKYFTPETLRAQRNNRSSRRHDNVMFAKHVDTESFKRGVTSIPSGSVIYITEKLHGTCVPYNSKIRMADGTVKKISKVNPGEFVLGTDKDGSLCPSEVLHVWNRGPAKEGWLKITGRRTGLGRGNATFNLVCTPDHLVFTESGYVEARNIKAGDKVLMCRNSLELTDVQKQVILGKLLGDGHLVLQCGSGKVEFRHKKSHELYLDWTLQGLQNLANWTKNLVVSGYGSEMVSAQSKVNPYIMDAFGDMILDGRKRVPEWVASELSPIAIAFWYMDDGSLSHNDSQEDRVSFATCAFDDADHEVLIKGLHKFGIEAKQSKHNGPNRLVLNADSSEKLFLLIAPYIHPIMQYKLPERYRGHNGWLPRAKSIYKPLTRWQVVDSVESAENIESNKWDMETETHNFMCQDVLVHNSFRYGHVLDDVPINYKGLSKLLSRIFKWPSTRKEWVYLNGSRNVILENRTEGSKGYYGTEEFRYRATRNITLHKGEVIYGELVGFTETGRPIMEPQSTINLKDKKIQNKFGDTIMYTYGSEQYICKLFVYRITRVNEDGNSVDLSWPQVEERCFELGLNPVPLISTFVYDGDKESLVSLVSNLTDGESGSEALPSRLDNSHIQEGVVVRYESKFGTGWLKSKSIIFGILEGYLKDSDNYVDTEEIS